MKEKNQSNSIDTFYGFWKYLGVTGIFFTGAALTWWGVNIMLNDWIAIRTAAGPMGNIVITPFVIGIVLAGTGLVEFLRIIREE